MATTDAVKTDAAKSEKATREKGPVAIEFIADGMDEAVTRVPEGVKSMVVTERASGSSKTYSISDLPETVLHQLAAAGLKKFVEMHIRNSANSADGDATTNVLESADSMFATLKSGKLYSRAGTGEKSAKVTAFDFDFWVDVSKVFTKRSKKRDATDAELKTFRTKLEALTPTERKEKIAAWKKANPLFNAAYLQVKAQYAVKTAGDKGDGELDLFA